MAFKQRRRKERAGSVLAAGMVLVWALAPASPDLIGGEPSIPIPPISTTVSVQDVRMAVVTSGHLTPTGSDHGQDTFQVDVSADLRDLQRNLVALLRPEIDRDDKCGDRIVLEEASLMPAPPTGMITARLHYERYACAKALGKQFMKKLVAGNALVEVRIIPRIEAQDTVKLGAEVTIKDVDGSLAEVLQAPDLRDKLREKIQSSVEKSLAKVSDKTTTLPAGVRDMAHIAEVRFADGGGGALLLEARGTLRMPAGEIKALLGGGGVR